VLRPNGTEDRIAAVALAAGRYVVGSAAACDIRIEAPGVEPKHCLIVTGPNRSAVRAYEPETRLNGVRVTEAPLAVGDLVGIGPIEMRLELPQGRLAGSDETPAASQATEQLLCDVQSEFAVSEEPDDRLRRWRDDLLRRENDLAISVAAVISSQKQRGFRKDASPECSEGQREDASVRLEQINRLRRRLTEITAELSASQADLLARERTLRERSDHVESWLASAAAAEAKCRSEEQHIAEERERFHAERHEIERRAAELARKTSELDERHEELDRLSAEVAAREQAVLDDTNSCNAARAHLAVDRAAISAQQDALRADRDRLAKDRLELAEERELLQAEIADLTRRREEAHAQIELALEEVQAVEELRASQGPPSAAESEALAATVATRHAAEVELAWRERELELREIEIGWQRSELADLAAQHSPEQAAAARDRDAFEQWRLSALAEREIELDEQERSLETLEEKLTAEKCAFHDRAFATLGEPGRDLAEWHDRISEENQRLSTLAEALAAERAALRAEEARFNAARREFGEEQERFSESVRLELARRDAAAAVQVAAASTETLAIAVQEPERDDSECVVDVAAGGRVNDVAESLREFEDALATLFDAGDATLNTDIIAADSNTGFWTPLEKVETPIRVGGYELDDADNPDSIARYMQELLQRIREDNPLVPPAHGDSHGAPSADVPPPAVPSPVFCEPFELPAARQPIDKDELRAQTESLRGVANISARSAIRQHSLRLKKAELFAKGVLTAIAIVIGGFLLAMYARSGGDYLWHVVAGFATVMFVTYDFLASFQKVAEQSKVES
ncbi:MAG: hypothetical protein M3552_11650, partial [Planctomycetota bacterium]|nr:hypothetical protein [Planctomycetota bacterium]